MALQNARAAATPQTFWLDTHTLFTKSFLIIIPFSSKILLRRTGSKKSKTMTSH